MKAAEGGRVPRGISTFVGVDIALGVEGLALGVARPKLRQVARGDRAAEFIHLQPIVGKVQVGEIRFQVDFTGTAVAPGYSVTLSGQSVLRHVLRRVDPLPLAPVAMPPPPTGTRNVTVTDDNADPGDFATINDLTVEGSGTTLALPPGTYGTLSVAGQATIILGVRGSTAPVLYNLQALQLAGDSQVQLVGPVILTVANGATVQAEVGSAAHPEWLTLRVAAGGVLVSGTHTFRGAVVAPNGTVTLGGTVTLIGTVAADRLVIGGSAVLIQPDQYSPGAP